MLLISADLFVVLVCYNHTDLMFAKSCHSL